MYLWGNVPTPVILNVGSLFEKGRILLVYIVSNVLLFATILITLDKVFNWFWRLLDNKKPDIVFIFKLFICDRMLFIIWVFPDMLINIFCIE